MKTSVVIVDAVSPGQPSLLYSFQILLLSMVSHSCNLKYSEAGALQKFKASLSYRICSRPVRADLSSQLKKKKKTPHITGGEWGPTQYLKDQLSLKVIALIIIL